LDVLLIPAFPLFKLPFALGDIHLCPQGRTAERRVGRFEIGAGHDRPGPSSPAPAGIDGLRPLLRRLLARRERRENDRGGLGTATAEDAAQNLRHYETLSSSTNIRRCFSHTSGPTASM